MKRKQYSIGQGWALSVCLLLGILRITSANAGESTAFDLAKEGNRYIGEQAKDKVVQIRSDKSVGSLTPTIWYVVYNDPTATFKCVEVKFGGGKMMAVKRPLHVGSHDPLNEKLLKIDSGKAVEIATKEPVLANLTLKATQLTLEESEGIPVWKVKLWAAKLSKPNTPVGIGDIVLSADDGKVMKLEVHPERVDGN